MFNAMDIYHVDNAVAECAHFGKHYAESWSRIKPFLEGVQNQTTNNARDEIFSRRICDYCQGCPHSLDGNCLEFDRFNGKKLTPVA